MLASLLSRNVCAVANQSYINIMSRRQGWCWCHYQWQPHWNLTSRCQRTHFHFAGIFIIQSLKPLRFSFIINVPQIQERWVMVHEHLHAVNKPLGLHLSPEELSNQESWQWDVFTRQACIPRKVKLNFFYHWWYIFWIFFILMQPNQCYSSNRMLSSNRDQDKVISKQWKIHN